MPVDEAKTIDDVQLLREAAEGCARLRGEIGRVIVGQDAVVRELLAAVLAEGHALIIGVPGLAKTLLVKTLGAALGWSFKRVQFTPDMMPSDITGMELLQENAGGVREWRFMHGPIFANLILADEINRTPPKTQAALLEAMQEYTVTSMGKSYALERPFVVVATQNPIEQEGTYPLPEAQLDRFMFSIRVEYPSRAEEERIVGGDPGAPGPRDAGVSRVFTHAKVSAIHALVRRVPASPHVVSYAVSLARATRPSDPESSELARRFVEWGAGPRGAQHLLRAAQALAVIDGAPAVTAKHIREAALPVLRHRVLPNFHAAGEGVTADELVKRIVTETKEPDYTRS